MGGGVRSEAAGGGRVRRWGRRDESGALASSRKGGGRVGGAERGTGGGV